MVLGERLCRSFVYWAESWMRSKNFAPNVTLGWINDSNVYMTDCLWLSLFIDCIYFFISTWEHSMFICILLGYLTITVLTCEWSLSIGLKRFSEEMSLFHLDHFVRTIGDWNIRKKMFSSDSDPLNDQKQSSFILVDDNLLPVPYLWDFRPKIAWHNPIHSWKYSGSYPDRTHWRPHGIPRPHLKSPGDRALPAFESHCQYPLETTWCQNPLEIPWSLSHFPHDNTCTDNLVAWYLDKDHINPVDWFHSPNQERCAKTGLEPTGTRMLRVTSS